MAIQRFVPRFDRAECFQVGEFSLELGHLPEGRGFHCWAELAEEGGSCFVDSFVEALLLMRTRLGVISAIQNGEKLK